MSNQASKQMMVRVENYTLYWDGPDGGARAATSAEVEMWAEIQRLRPMAESWESYEAVQDRKSEPVETKVAMGPREPDNSMVICPACTCQFPAISVNDQATRSRLVAALEMMYDRYEDGSACYEDPDNLTGYLGNAMKLTEQEDIEILSLIPAQKTNGDPHG